MGDASVQRRSTSKWPIAVLVAATLLTLAPVCGHPFVHWDDTHNFERDNSIARAPIWDMPRFWSEPIKDLYVPVTYTVWWIVGALARTGDGSLNAHVFHTINLLLHVVTAMAVFNLLRRLGFGPWPACAGALVFAVHPVQVEAVAWASGTKDLLAGLFSILALHGFVRAIEHPTEAVDGRAKAWIAWATTAFIAAMLSKPSAVVVPALAAVLVWFRWPRQRRSITANTPWWTILIAWVLLSIPVVAVARGAQSVKSVAAPGISFRGLVAYDSLAFYVHQVAAPMHLAIDYGRSPTWLAHSSQRFWTWLVPAVLALLAVAVRRRVPAALAALLLFTAAISPVMGFVPFDFQSYSTVADHYLYVAMFAIALLVADLGARIRRPAVYACLGIWILVLAGRSHVQTWTWRDSEELFQHTLAINPNSVVAAVNLGNIRADEADWLKAEGRGDAAIARSDEAIALYLRALESSHTDTQARANLGRMYKLQRRWSEAEAQYRAILEIRQEDVEAHIQLGVVLGNQGRLLEAIHEFQEALRFEPGEAEAQRLFDQAAQLLPRTRPGVQGPLPR